MSRLALFAYGSLASRASASLTLGREVGPGIPARLPGWARRWTLVRNNRTAEKTFVLTRDGSLPDFCLGLSLEPAAAEEGPNGALLALGEAELDRLDLREMRYSRIDVSAAVRTAEGAPHGFSTVLAYRAKPENHAPAPPAGAVILASYLRAVESAFDALGPGELDLFRATTAAPPVDVVEAALVRDEIPPGNPRAW